MEQALNSFTKGLLLDTNPMVLGNDTLTDCLNGTIVTMNGNEVVLLNDMGNRRVDMAFLPSGYLPVGMKEYGGIIYVASYNPITNKSLLGSFPSPLRRISNYDDPDLEYSGNISFNTVLREDWRNLSFLEKTSQIVTLTGDTSLHSGDKFVVYGNLEIDGSNRTQQDISNYENVQGSKILSPKNKRYTLSLGILNSKNEFSDITPSLCRWEINPEYELITTFSNDSSSYKFNKGYFIVPHWEKPNYETIDDAKLIEIRRTLPANTYSYKLVGPLCLKVDYNHILNINFLLDAEKRNDGKYNLIVYGNVIYNCPDNAQSSEGNSIYADLEEGIILDINILNGFDLYEDSTTPLEFYSDGVEVYYGQQNNVTYELNSKPIYKDDGTYEITIKKVYKGVRPTKGSLFNYILAVGEKNKYIIGLSSRGSIDLNKIGSGSIDINEWRFRWENGKLLLKAGIEAYPKQNETFVDFTIHIENQSISRNTLYFNTVISEEISGLELLKVYLATINYYIKNKYGLYKNNNGEFSETPYMFTYSDNFIYWILTTLLFNEFFNSSGGRQIKNYAKLRDENLIELPINQIDPSMTYSFEQEWIKEKLIIGPKFNIFNLLENNIKSSFSGSLISNVNENIEISNTLTKEYRINTRMNLDIDKNLYPDYILWIDNFDSSSILITNILSNESLVEEAIQKYIVKYGLENKNNLSIDFIQDSFSLEDGIISGLVSWKDIHIYSPKRILENIMDAFDYITSFLDKLYENKKKYCSYSGLVLAGVGHLNEKDEHYKGLLIGYVKDNYAVRYTELSNSDYLELITLNNEEYDASEDINANGLFANTNFDVLENIDEVDPDKTFAYLYYRGSESPARFFHVTSWESHWRSSEYYPGRMLGGYRSMLDKSRLLWRDSTGHWALVDGLYLDFNLGHIANQLRLVFDSDVLFCMHGTISPENFTLYRADSLNPIYKHPRYGIDKDEEIHYELTITLLLNSGINFANNLRPSGSILMFQQGTGEYNTTVPITKIESSEVFWNYIDGINELSLQYIDIIHGLNIDSDGNFLRPENVYIYNQENNLLIKWINAPISSYKFESGERCLACVSKKDGISGYDYDVYSESDHANSMSSIRYNYSGLIDNFKIRNVNFSALRHP